MESTEEAKKLALPVPVEETKDPKNEVRRP